VSELSGLAWCEDENILYALSDNGYLLHLRPVFNEIELTDILLLDGYALLDEKGKPLKWKKADSEGLSIVNNNNNVIDDTELLISFERIPRIIKYKTNGEFIEEINLPEKLRDISNYRSENKSTEALTHHNELGLLLGNEYPLIDTEYGNLSIYSISGDKWIIPAQNKSHGGLVGMTTLINGDLLILERAYTSIVPQFEITLHRLSIIENKPTREIIITILPEQEIFNDNFEGITRHTGNKFFMVSDDNNHPFKRTLLVYFSVINDH